jgi:hypothetical protein
LLSADFEDDPATPGYFQPDAASQFVLRYNCAKGACRSDTDSPRPPLARRVHRKVFGKIIVMVEAPPVVPIIDDIMTKFAISSKPDATNPTLEKHDTTKSLFKPYIPGSYFITLFTTNCVKINCSTTTAIKVTDTFKSGKADMECPGHNQVVHWSTLHTHKDDPVNVNLNSSPSGAKKLKYSWSFHFLPAASTLTVASLSTADSASASFFPNTLGKYGLKFSVSGYCSTNKDSVTINDACPSKFTAYYAGKDQHSTSCALFKLVTIQGYHGETYGAQPIHGQFTPLVSFTPDTNGRYEVQCLVFGGCNGASKTAAVWFRCSDFTPPILAGGNDLALHRQCGKTPSLTVTNDNALASIHYYWSFISPGLLDDDTNAKTEFFNKKFNKIRMPIALDTTTLSSTPVCLSSPMMLAMLINATADSTSALSLSPISPAMALDA